jgi:hypothetical protein
MQQDSTVLRGWKRVNSLWQADRPARVACYCHACAALAPQVRQQHLALALALFSTLFYSDCDKQSRVGSVNASTGSPSFC